MNILHEADKLTSQDRQEVYEHPIVDFTRATRMYEPILESDIDPRLKHALVMIQVKIARLLNTPDHHDSVVDIAGYARTYEMILEETTDKHTQN